MSLDESRLLQLLQLFMIPALCMPGLGRIFGLTERLFYSMISWFLIIGVELVSMARGEQRIRA